MSSQFSASRVTLPLASTCTPFWNIFGSNLLDTTIAVSSVPAIISSKNEISGLLDKLQVPIVVVISLSLVGHLSPIQSSCDTQIQRILRMF